MGTLSRRTEKGLLSINMIICAVILMFPCIALYIVHAFMIQGIEQLCKSFDMLPSAVLSGLLLLTGYRLSQCVVKVPSTNWVEPVLIWLTICMPTGSGKTPLYTFLVNILNKVRQQSELSQDDPSWFLDEASFEMMGALMSRNDNKITRTL